MSASLSHAASAEPNLTPMLDMVFQLITFFMLILNFKAQSMDLHLKLPVFGAARPPEQDQGEVITLNLDEAGKLTVQGQPKDLTQYIQSEAAASRQTAQRIQPGFKDGDALPATVAIRADFRIRFGVLSKAIKVCQDNGFRRFALRASNKAEGT